MSIIEIDLDHPRLRTVLKSANPGESDPSWELTARTVMGNVLDFNSSDTKPGLVTLLCDLLGQPELVTRIDLIVWVPS
ncbi:hypothetical protein ACK8HH_17315 [Gordonia sp. LUNF6]|uniref:hypothetical protein n=1 Tax=unclassified Gordonia (in: high G+C Gram-positive bacteria) TaxID=2657482 RepID=UPI000781519C|nr:hypothetical protein [Gordonia sp. QH-12]KXT57334.1 hypothetical protein Y710_09540 [Gordonia sp. QH-12]